MADPSKRNIDGIYDNSFFIEEAYNQEPGVVQHIFTTVGLVEQMPGSDSEAWALAFTQEWPLFSRDHQISYTIPYNFLRADGQSEDGIGNVRLNYRYQVYFNEETLTAFAPDFGLLLPTADERRGLGEDTVGYSLNLPFSTTFGDSWFAHLNAGTMFLPNATSAGDHDVWRYNIGASAIYAATPDIHFLLEWIGEGEERPGSSEFISIISPGVRKAFNFRNGAQLVIGVAVPLGLTSNAPDYGVFLYFSFEHAFMRTAKL